MYAGNSGSYRTFLHVLKVAVVPTEFSVIHTSCKQINMDNRFVSHSVDLHTRAVVVHK